MRQTFSSTSPPIMNVDALTSEEQASILELASKLIALFVHDRQIDFQSLFARSKIESLLSQHVYGVFTTLKRDRQLRGCCGSIGTLQPLGETLVNACRRTALEDKRMPAISPTELPHLSLDVSLLEGLEAVQEYGIERKKAFVIGRHGLHIQRGRQTGLLLPSVSVEQGWDAEEFLRAVCRKAGLSDTDWLQSDCQLQRFAGKSIRGRFDHTVYAGLEMRRSPPVSSDQLRVLQRAVVANLRAFSRGATPSYIVADAPDGTVHGIVLSLLQEQSKRPMVHLIRLSMRPGIPLQSSLFELTTVAHDAIQQLRAGPDSQVEIAITILSDPSAHGVVTLADTAMDRSKAMETIRMMKGLEGISGTGRAIIAMDRQGKVAVSHHPTEAVEQQVFAMATAIAAYQEPFSIFTMDAVATRPHLLATNVAMPESQSSEREPAVADRFYPADDRERHDLVRKIFDDLPKQAARASSSNETSKSPSGHGSLLAIMTPHAGLKYSGRVAAQVWREVVFPRRLLMIGPKHTRLGVAWAVAPQATWNLSRTAQFGLDVDLASKIASRVDGMQLDAAAHRGEHGVEVQLPLLEYLFPTATFVAIAMQTATWPTIRAAAAQLATVLANEPDLPLLVISSDMNHYAPELENRRRDRLALDAMIAKDPQRLIEVCQKHEISMCGLAPAALVMQTLAELGRDYLVQEVAYATSGDVAKSDRVVGYAGLTFSTDAS